MIDIIEIIKWLDSRALIDGVTETLKHEKIPDFLELC